MSPPSPFFTLRRRLVAAALLWFAELLSLTVAVDLGPLKNMSGLARLAGAYGSTALHFLVVAILFSLAFSALRSPRLFLDSGCEFERSPFVGFTAVHLAVFGFFAGCSLLLCRVASPAARDFLIAACVVSGIATVFSCALAFVRAAFWQRLLRSAPAAPCYGAAVASGAFALLWAFDRGASPWLGFTFYASRRVLSLLVPAVVSDPRTSILGTPAFQVMISEQCSGYEGIALVLVFTSAWLWFFRREFRFPQAFLMIPAGVVCSWLLNVARIVILILIGNAGAPRIAAGGFHSVAGWVAFVLLAISLAVVFHRSSYTSLQPLDRAAAEPPLHTETAAYLVPFLAILAAGMVAQGASSGFEWLYPLRVAAAAGAVWRYRVTLSKLSRHIGPGSAAVGVLAFILWIAWDRILRVPSTGMPAPLAMAPSWLRDIWLAFRALGGIVTVPIAEELAFRGFLMRRFVSPGFAAVSFRQAGVFAVCASSAFFGLLHGRMWAPGMVVGLLYAALARRSGRLSDAIAAHAVTNALLAVTVLYTGDWHLW